jgi:UDP-N-acetylmuramoyl-L-alanyl-D-glutamate--2,6-diaminopimelate ligase
LRALLAQVPLWRSPGDVPDVGITGVAVDSRKVKAGELFVALRGGSVDGHTFISSAIANGAAAIVGDRDMPGLDVPYIRLKDAREALTWVAAAFFDWPARKLTVIGVTGTDGKTTTTSLIHRILVTAGLRAGMISTVHAVIGDAVLDTGFHVTTPDAQDLQAYLAMMVRAGLTHVVLETTSHGWAQHRADACEFDIGVVTNITHEHLDQHGSYEEYRAAKARLFTSLEITQPKARGNPRLAIINRDDTSFEFLSAFINVRTQNYGFAMESDVRAERVQVGPAGTTFLAVGEGFRVAISTPLLGLYNVSNCLAALSVAICGLGLRPDLAAAGIAQLDGIPGRMERVEAGQDFTTIVDFAHTPNALKVTLETARTMLREVPGQPRTICVFGSAGLRDKAKRRMMAEVAAELADLTVLTAEDPRTESLNSILDEMGVGARSRGGQEGKTFWRVPDRGEAIKFALSLARTNDVVLVCGKGHEQSMCFGRTEYPWDDRVALRAALMSSRGLDGPPMPYLPTQDRPEAEWLN